ncbi:MAG: hypothetical protein DI528_05715 [Shinella sp.]|nr:MAG: hypothetical protein DI528_05715 [Shinella sp.]
MFQRDTFCNFFSQSRFLLFNFRPGKQAYPSAHKSDRKAGSMKMTVSGVPRITQSVAVSRKSQQQAIGVQFGRMIAILEVWYGRYMERRQLRNDLSAMTDEMLKDYRLTRKQAKKIANAPFWRA